ncbi:multiple sugar transport system permease protein [Propionicimonas paludicola]|uniref:Multiple sugar transport system permease protein n=1 Tax=Propionicimonas paludicola TaxID=185243 RepID=A0A2A9CV12_9ACTN|nr:sugar ABC transporter permease [Propionicimonas paludicola]PFG17986.1 multiple sugar transport system permease protein [Propionicimonas paludicola]
MAQAQLVIRSGETPPSGSPRSPRRRRYDREQVITAAVFLAPALVVLAVFVFYPILAAGQISLTSWNGFDPVQPFVGLGNYQRLAQDPEFWNSLAVTVGYALGVCVLSVVSGLAIALLLDAPLRGLGIYRSIYFLPVVTSSVAAAIVWRYLLDPSGLVNSVLAQFGIAGPDWLQDRYLALGALTLLTVWKNIGFNAVLYLTALQALPHSIYEAAGLDGASGWQKLRHLTIPLLSPMTFFVVVQALITSFQAFDLVYVFTEGGPRGGTDVLGMFMYRTAFRLGDFGYGTAIAFVTLALVLGVTLVQWRVTGSDGTER